MQGVRRGFVACFLNPQENRCIVTTGFNFTPTQMELERDKERFEASFCRHELVHHNGRTCDCVGMQKAICESLSEVIPEPLYPTSPLEETRLYQLVRGGGPVCITKQNGHLEIQLHTATRARA